MIDLKYLEAIKKFEGYTSRSQWDYAQNTNGYGTRSLYAGENIDQAEAERRFKAEIADAYAIVDRFVPKLDEGTKAALTSLTFNAGSAWMRSGLGAAIKNGDLDTARQVFLNYNKARGEVLPGLVSRRQTEESWFGGSGTELLASAASIPMPSEQMLTGDAVLHNSSDVSKAPMPQSTRHFDAFPEIASLGQPEFQYGAFVPAENKINDAPSQSVALGFSLLLSLISSARILPDWSTEGHDGRSDPIEQWQRIQSTGTA